MPRGKSLQLRRPGNWPVAVVVYLANKRGDLMRLGALWAKNGLWVWEVAEIVLLGSDGGAGQAGFKEACIRCLVILCNSSEQLHARMAVWSDDVLAAGDRSAGSVWNASTAMSHLSFGASLFDGVRHGGPSLKQCGMCYLSPL